MKKIFMTLLPGLILSFLLMGASVKAADVAVNAANFPDEIFRSYVSSDCDTDGNGVLSEAEISAVDRMEIRNKDIKDLKGVEFFTSMTQLICSGNPFTGLDVSKNTELIELNCAGCGLTSLDVSKNALLYLLYCQNNQLTNLNVSQNTSLDTLYCHYNQLTNLDVGSCPDLERLHCNNNQLKALDVSKNTALKYLVCSGNELTELDIRQNKNLEQLDCVYNDLAALNVYSNSKLKMLDCYANDIDKINIVFCPDLLDAYWNGEQTVQSAHGGFVEYLIYDEEDPLDSRILRAASSTEIADDVSMIRIFGNTRYQTSIKIADMLKLILGVDQFDTMVLVSGQDFPDGLSASTLADALRAPILTTDGKASHYKATNEYVLENLAPGGTVYIIGGENAIPEEAVAGLSSVHCVRLAGNTRYLTNMAVFDECRRLYPEARGQVIIATGTSFPDSLSVSSTGAGLFLVNGEKGTLTAKQKTYLADLAEAGFSFTIVGGPNAVSEELEASIEECIGQDAYRIAGSTRYKTSAAIAEEYFRRANRMILCYGDNFPDALCAGPLGAALRAPVVLTKSGNTSALNAAKTYASDHNIHFGLALGGPGLISDADVRAILDLGADEEIAVR